MKSIVDGMALDRAVRDRDETAPTNRQYVVTCDDCSFEETVHGVEGARAAAGDHSDSTDHQVIALEVPATS